MGYSQDVLSTLDIYAEIRPVITTLLAEFVKKGTYRNIDRGRKYFEVYTSKYHPQEFLHWTGCTQQGLEESWLISSAKEAVGLLTGYRSTCARRFRNPGGGRSLYRFRRE